MNTKFERANGTGLGLKPKTRVFQPMKDITKNSNRSAELHSLATQFDVLKIKLFQLIEALKLHYKSMTQMNKTRVLMAEKIASLARGSPLSVYTGAITFEGSDEVTISNMTTYLDIHQNLSLRHKMYTDRFLDHIVKYAIEWFEVTQTKVLSFLKSAQKTRKEVDHYETKVTRIHFDAKRHAKSGNDSKAFVNSQAKLSRNEIKLQQSRKEYDTVFNATASIVDEVTKGCWKDLFPVLVKLTQFDDSLASDEHNILKQLSSVSKDLMKVQTKYNIDPQTRLSKIASYGYENGNKIMEEQEEDRNDGEEDRNDGEESVSNMTNDTRDAVISGVQNKLKNSKNNMLIKRQGTPQTSNTTDDAFGSTTIRTYTGESPKIEVNADFNKYPFSKQRSFTGSLYRGESPKFGVNADFNKYPFSKQRSFTGKATDQNTRMPAPVRKMQVKKQTERVNSSQSYCNSNASTSPNPFHDIDTESSVYTLRPYTTCKI